MRLSFTKKPTRNRKIQKRAPMDWSKARDISRRIGRFVAFYGGAGLFVAGIYLTGVMVYERIMTSGYFAIDSIEIVGASRIEEEEIALVSDISLGDHIFSVDEEEARASILDLPWIKDAEITVSLPRSVTIQIWEYEPSTLIVMDSIFYVDVSGTVFAKVAPEDDVDLPLITGLSWKELLSPDTAQDTKALIKEAVSIHRTYKDMQLSSFHELSEIHYDELFGFSLFTLGVGPVVRLGRGTYKKKLHRLTHVLLDLDEQNKAAVMVHLDNATHPGRVVVKTTDSAILLSDIQDITTNDSNIE